MTYRIQQLKLGGILDQSIALVKNHFGLFFGIICILFIPYTLISTFVVTSVLPTPPQMGATPEEFMAFQKEAASHMPLILGSSLISFIIILPLTNAAVVDAVAKVYLGQPASAMGSLQVGFSRLPPLIWTTILMSVAIMFGFILLIIPGIIFSFWYSLSTHAVVVEKISGGAAMKRSKQLVSGNIGTLFVLGIVISAIAFGIGLVAGMIPQIHAQMVVRVMLQAVMTVFSTAALVVFYFSCRCEKDNFDLEHLAQSMGESVPVANDDPDQF